VRHAVWLPAAILVVVLVALVLIPPVAKEAPVVQPGADKATPSIAAQQPTAIPTPVPSEVTGPSIQSAAASDLIRLAISNLRDTLFTVSWLTAETAKGQVQLADGTTYGDARGSDFVGTTHYVTVTGLLANREYSFDVISGGGRYDQAGAHWTVKTGDTLAPRTPDLVFGRIRNPDGSNAANVIVFSIIDRVQQGVGSAPLSTLVTARDGGSFSVDLGETRAWSDPTKHFAYAVSSDRYMNNAVTFQAVGAGGAGLLTVDAGDEGLRSSDPRQWLVIHLVASAH
jgi:hypothetical protein